MKPFDSIHKYIYFPTLKTRLFFYFFNGIVVFQVRNVLLKLFILKEYTAFFYFTFTKLNKVL